MARLRQIPESQWRKPAILQASIILPWRPSEMEALFDVRFDECQEDLGLMRFAFVAVDDSIYMLEAYPDGSAQAQKVQVTLSIEILDTKAARRDLLQALGLSANDAQDYHDLCAEWSLIRMDEHGTEVEIDRYMEEGTAKTAQAAFEARGHKQAYFVRRISN